MSYYKQHEKLGQALNVIQNYNRNFDVSEGNKARFNHYVRGLFSSFNKEDRNTVAAQMDFDYLETIGVFKD